MREYKLNDTVTFIIPKLTVEENRKRLIKFYDKCNEIFKDNPECFYTKEEVKKLKENPNNKFI